MIASARDLPHVTRPPTRVVHLPATPFPAPVPPVSIAPFSGQVVVHTEKMDPATGTRECRS